MTNSQKRLVLPLVATVILVSTLGLQVRPASASPMPFHGGDVIASVGDGLVQHYDSAGNLLETLDTSLGAGIYTTGCAFDSVGNLYVTTFNGGGVTRFAGPGVPHSLLGTFGSSYSGSPESLVFDSHGNVYVGSVNGDNQVRKFDAAGNPLAQYALAIDDRGSDWVDLAADEKTLFYSSEGKRILRYDTQTNTQLADFATGLPGTAAYALRILPDGGVLVADSEYIFRLDSAANIVETYTVTGENTWFALNLDPDGKSFWSGNFGTGVFYKFDIATGQVLLTVNTQRPGLLFGLCVYKEVTVGTLDSDGDGLPDDWEKNGIAGVDIPGMGALPDVKDVFVEVDWMQDATHNQKPDASAIQKIVNAFANSGVDSGKGIRLHVDVGPDSIDYVTGKPWGPQGKGHAVTYQDIIGKSQPLEQDVNNLLQSGAGQSFLVFHRAIFIHEFHNSSDNADCHTGISLGASGTDKIEQVFLVALGCTSNGKGTTNEQAGTFMHELGHNVGLCHGGPATLAVPDGQCNINYKPNYLSVMNYSFQTSGLFVNGTDGHFDYSKFGQPNLPDLNKNSLHEADGVKDDRLSNYGTKYAAQWPFLCLFTGAPRQFEDGHVRLLVKQADGPIDWNCNRSIDTGNVPADINGEGNDQPILKTYDDWDNLNFKIGNIGLGGNPPPVTITADDVISAPVEITPQEDSLIQRESEPRVQLSTSVTPTSVFVGQVLTYTISLFNGDAGNADGVVVTDTLPVGFVYQAGSTSGAVTSDPVVIGQSLMWSPFSVPATSANSQISFRAVTGDAPGTYLSNASGNSINGIVLGSGDTAPVTVLPFYKLLLPIVRR